MSVQDLARTLAAAGSIRLDDDEGIYLLQVSNGSLVEKYMVGDEVKNETVVTTNARNDTSASYLLAAQEEDDIERRVIFIDKAHAIQCYVCNDDLGKWNDTGLGEKWKIVTGPNSKLSANIRPDGGVAISFQDAAGRLTGMMSAGGGEWKTFGPLDADAVAGSPQILEVIDDKLHLFYVGPDGGVRYLVHDPQTGNWQANTIEIAKFETPIDKLNVTKNLETGSFQSYVLSAGSLWSVDGSKEKTPLGEVEASGKLNKSDHAQAGWRVWWSGARKVRVNRYGDLTIWY